MLKFCGYGITAVHQPSKLVMGVRLPLPAPDAVVEFPSGQRGQTVNLLSPTSMVRIHLPPPFLTIQHLNFEVLFLLSKNGVEDNGKAVVMCNITG